MTAAQAAGYIFDPELTVTEKNWFDLPRATRALMVAQNKIENITSAIMVYNQKEENKTRGGH